MSARQGAAMFERLLVLRDCYPLRSDYDRRPVLSVEAAIDYGEWRMRLARISDLKHGVWNAPRAA